MKIRWWPRGQKYVWVEGRWGLKIGCLLIWFGQPDYWRHCVCARGK